MLSIKNVYSAHFIVYLVHFQVIYLIFVNKYSKIIIRHSWKGGIYMNICICDDETSCTEYINTLITGILPECNTYIFESGETLLRSTIKFDIAFLDIEMKEVNGIDTATELIKRMPGIIIIFVSSYSGYVTEAFSLQAFQYLLKPVNEQKFIEEFNKALEAYKMKHYTHPIKYGNSVSYISVKDILYIETLGRKLRLKTTNSSFEYYAKIRDEYATLKAYGFTKAHQGCIVNMFHVTNISKLNFTMSNEEIITISRQESKQVHEDFTEFIGKVLV